MHDTDNGEQLSYAQQRMQRRNEIKKERKRKSSIRLVILIFAEVAILVLFISAIVRMNQNPSMQGSNSTTGDTETTQDVTKPQNSTHTQGTTLPQESIPSQDEIQAQADALVAKADFIAAGYDYKGAIELLESFKYFDMVPTFSDKIAEYQKLDSKLISYPRMSQITHIFFHSLIVDTDRAFDGEYTDDGYNLYMTTVDEFNAILQQMYDRGYVLVSPYDVAYEVTDENGTRFTYGDIRLPAGKTPFLMSQDDVNYYGYMISNDDGSNEIPARPTTQGDGFAFRLVIGKDGFPTCEYMDANGNITTGDYDLVPLLERFIQAHPDFSYHGARAILGVTGYEGVLGYHTKPSYETTIGTAAYQKEIADAKAVVQNLKEHGWILASHSYGHPAYGSISAERVAIDSEKWEATCQPVIGDTDIILYPHGSDIAGIEKYAFTNEKFKTLYEDGYRYFFNVDSSISWTQLGSNYYRGGRRNLDGYRMYHNPGLLNDLFDVSAVFDKNRPIPVPQI